jgi:predicted pyridoxine 5'-phosphate oxidase superfamily flavin-nucleotide-binding protein
VGRDQQARPRGDAPGFVHVLDEQHLAIPDRAGNNRLDTFENLLANPAIGLFFVMPAVLPPPEEQKDVKTAIGAARAKQERSRMKKAS